MAIVPVDVGTTANDGTGDLHRDAFIKLNGNDSDLDSRVTSLEGAGGGAGFPDMVVPTDFTQAALRAAISSSESHRTQLDRGDYTAEDILADLNIWYGRVLRGTNRPLTTITAPVGATKPVIDFRSTGQKASWGLLSDFSLESGAETLDDTGTTEPSLIHLGTFVTSSSFPFDFMEFERLNLDGGGLNHGIYIPSGATASRFRFLSIFKCLYAIYFDGTEIRDLVMEDLRLEGDSGFTGPAGGIWINAGRETGQTSTKFTIRGGTAERLNRPGLWIRNARGGVVDSGFEAGNAPIILDWGASQVTLRDIVLHSNAIVSDAGWGNRVIDARVGNFNNLSSVQLVERDRYKPAGLLANGLMETAEGFTTGTPGASLDAESATHQAHAYADGKPRFGRVIRGGSDTFESHMVTGLTADSWYVIDLGFRGQARVVVTTEDSASLTPAGVLLDTNPSGGLTPDVATAADLWTLGQDPVVAGTSRSLNLESTRTRFLHFKTPVGVTTVYVRLYGNTTLNPTYTRFTVHPNLFDNPLFDRDYTSGIPAGWTIGGTGTPSQDAGMTLDGGSSLKLAVTAGQTVNLETGANFFPTIDANYLFGMEYRLDAINPAQGVARMGVGFLNSNAGPNCGLAVAHPNVWVPHVMPFRFHAGTQQGPQGFGINNRLYLFDIYSGAKVVTATNIWINQAFLIQQSNTVYTTPGASDYEVMDETTYAGLTPEPGKVYFVTPDA